MASQPARSLRRSKSSVKGEVQGPQQKMKLADAMKTKAASIGVENTIENRIEAPAPVPSKKRTRRQANAEVTSAPSKRRKIENKEQAPAVEQAPAKTQALKAPARQILKTYTSTRSRSASAQPATARSEGPSSDTQKTVSQSKVANGLQHELERLGPAPANLSGKDGKDGKRKLRSEGRAKFKSELGVYFPEYEVIMGNEEAVETSMFTQLSHRISYTNLLYRPFRTRNSNLDCRLGAFNAKT